MMLRVIALAALTTVLVVPAYAAPPEKGDAKPFEFIGFSTTTTTGNVGLPAMNEICQADLGRTDARMATSKEFIESANTSTPGTLAWINPFYIGTEANALVDFSGALGNFGELDCGTGWQASAGGLGLVVTNIGAFNTSDCSQSHLVACSARGQ